MPFIQLVLVLQVFKRLIVTMNDKLFGHKVVFSSLKDSKKEKNMNLYIRMQDSIMQTKAQVAISLE